MRTILYVLISLAFVNQGNNHSPSDNEVKIIFDESGLNNYLEYNVFEVAYKGSKKIENLKKSHLLTIIDFSKASTSDRLFVVDLKKKELLIKSLVAHGKNSGGNYATSFSNESKSFKSSLGFYKTAETYNGKHGYSLRLDGLEPGFNDNARKRAIVIHGAWYVSSDFSKKNGRLGRSWGCPSLPLETAKEIIDSIKNGSCLFIYAKDESYLAKSAYMN